MGRLIPKKTGERLRPLPLLFCRLLYSKHRFCKMGFIPLKEIREKRRNHLGVRVGIGGSHQDPVLVCPLRDHVPVVRIQGVDHTNMAIVFLVLLSGVVVVGLRGQDFVFAGSLLH